MSQWVSRAIADTIHFLDDQGQEELSRNLQRLLEDPTVTGAQIWRFSDVSKIANEILAAETLEDLQQILPEVARAFRSEQCTVKVVRDIPDVVWSARVITTNDRLWAAEYVRHNLAAIDPVILRARQGESVFFWDELDRRDPFTAMVLDMRASRGIGPGGVTVTRRNPCGNLIAVTLNASLGGIHYRAALAERMSDLEDLAGILADVFTELSAVQIEARHNAPIDHLQFLRGLAAGRTMEEIIAHGFPAGCQKAIEADILRSFGARTLAQAAVIASRQGLLDDLPYTEDEILARETGQDPIEALLGLLPEAARVVDNQYPVRGQT